MSHFTPEQLAYFYGFPAWAVAACAVALFGIAIAVLLFIYARAMSKRGVLR